MPTKRMRALFVLALLASASAVATAAPLPALDPAPWQPDFSVPASLETAALLPLAAEEIESPALGTDSTIEAAVEAMAAAQTPVPASGHRPLRQLLADFAVTLRDIRYRRGGREPSTGFDCSGFVRYVFRHSLGQDLPTDSASQFHAGAKVARGEMKTGDLVFFRTRGQRVSHVGIYLDNGRFIHAPSAGKRVSISNLDETYWAKRFVGAKRPHGLS